MKNKIMFKIVFMLICFVFLLGNISMAQDTSKYEVKESQSVKFYIDHSNGDNGEIELYLSERDIYSSSSLKWRNEDFVSRIKLFTNFVNNKARKEIIEVLYNNNYEIIGFEVIGYKNETVKVKDPTGVFMFSESEILSNSSSDKTSNTSNARDIDEEINFIDVYISSSIGLGEMNLKVDGKDFVNSEELNWSTSKTYLDRIEEFVTLVNSKQSEEIAFAVLDNSLNLVGIRFAIPKAGIIEFSDPTNSFSLSRNINMIPIVSEVYKDFNARDRKEIEYKRGSSAVSFYIHSLADNTGEFQLNFDDNYSLSSTQLNFSTETLLNERIKLFSVFINEFFKDNVSESIIDMEGNNIGLTIYGSQGANIVLSDPSNNLSFTHKDENVSSQNPISSVMTPREGAQGCTEDMNWKQTIIRNEFGDVVSQTRVYLDGLGRPVQTQTSNLTEEKILANQTIYDEFGRPLIKSLSAPLANNVYCYVDDFMQNSTGTKFTSSDINDNRDDIYHQDYGTLGWYYSNENTIEPFVPASAQPYSEVEYYDDPFGSLRKVANVGEQHKMESGHERKFIQSVSNNELDYVFGKNFSYLVDDDENEILESKYIEQDQNRIKLIKSISIDEEGTESISYTNSQGLLIASCNSGFEDNTCISQDIETRILANKNQTVHIPQNKMEDGIEFSIPKKFTNHIYELEFMSAQYTVSLEDVKQKFDLYIFDVLTNTRLINGTDYFIEFECGTNDKPCDGVQDVFIDFLTGENSYTYKCPVFEGTKIVFSDEIKAKSGFFNISYELKKTFYKKHLQPPFITLNYQTEYSNWALNYYNTKGQLKKSISPKGVDCNYYPYYDAVDYVDKYSKDVTNASTGQYNFLNNDFFTHNIIDPISTHDHSYNLELAFGVKPFPFESDPNYIMNQINPLTHGGTGSGNGGVSTIPAWDSQPCTFLDYHVDNKVHPNWYQINSNINPEHSTATGFSMPNGYVLKDPTKSISTVFNSINTGSAVFGEVKNIQESRYKPNLMDYIDNSSVVVTSNSGGGAGAAFPNQTIDPPPLPYEGVDLNDCPCEGCYPFQGTYSTDILRRFYSLDPDDRPLYKQNTGAISSTFGAGVDLRCFFDCFSRHEIGEYSLADYVFDIDIIAYDASGVATDVVKNTQLKAYLYGNLDTPLSESLGLFEHYADLIEEQFHPTDPIAPSHQTLQSQCLQPNADDIRNDYTLPGCDLYFKWNPIDVDFTNKEVEDKTQFKVVINSLKISYEVQGFLPGSNGDPTIYHKEHTFSSDFDLNYKFHDLSKYLTPKLKVTESVYVRPVPNHTMPTNFAYDQWGMLIASESVDEGLAEVKYDKEGKVIASQTADQRQENKFSYVKYDESDRAMEVGVYSEPSANGFHFYSEVLDETASPVSNLDIIETNLAQFEQTSNNTDKSEQSFSYYDRPDQNLETMIAEALTNTIPISNSGVDINWHAELGAQITEYKQRHTTGALVKQVSEHSSVLVSYDELGRSEYALKYINDLGTKTFHNEYDLFGNILRTAYQKDNPTESFFHHYLYDDDLRLSSVFTSLDGSLVNAQQQAKYHYYTHGPLKRTELRENLQGIDYVYTIQGWLKSINNPDVKNRDPGKDGGSFIKSTDLYGIGTYLANTPVAVPYIQTHKGSGSTGSFDYGSLVSSTNDFAGDLFGETIDYFEGDYSRSGTYVQTAPNYVETVITAAMGSTKPPLNYNSGTKDHFNGLIKSIRWQTVEDPLEVFGSEVVTQAEYDAIINNGTAIAGQTYTTDNKIKMYGYDYDEQYRLKSAVYYDLPSISNLNKALADSDPYETMQLNNLPDYRLNELTYDRNGNIKSLTRKGNSINGLQMDKLDYTYNAGTNQIDHVTDAYSLAFSANYATDFETQIAGNYVYNNAGKIIEDKEKDIKIFYNAIGKVKEVTDLAGVLKVRYTYDESGSKLKKTTYNGIANKLKDTWYVNIGGMLASIYEQDYAASSTEAVQTEAPLYGADRLGVQYFNNTAGIRQKLNAHYELKDHLDNVRVVINDHKDSYGNAIVMSRNDFYPFGGIHPGKSLNPHSTRVGYQGQEFDTETGMYSFDLRMYNPDLGRWLSPDPYGQHYSPYLAMSNNPVSFIDPDGGQDGPTIIANVPEATVIGRKSETIEDFSFDGSGNRPHEMLGVDEAGNIVLSKDALTDEQKKELRDMYTSFIATPSVDNVDSNIPDITFVEAQKLYVKTKWTPSEILDAMDNWDPIPLPLNVVANSPYLSHYNRSRYLLYGSQVSQMDAVVKAPFKILLAVLPEGKGADALFIPAEIYLTFGGFGGFGGISKVKRFAPVYKYAGKSKTIISSSGYLSSNGVNLNKHLSYLQKYGKTGFKSLENGSLRYYGKFNASSTKGTMFGRKTVFEWNPSSGNTRAWMETYDGANNVRIARPQFGTEKGLHYMFDSSGKFNGTF